MAVRPSMAAIILELRALTDASLGETTVNGITFWDDDQLQAILDQYRVDILDVALQPAAQRVAGSTGYLRYYFPSDLGFFIEEDFAVTDDQGNPLTGWTYTPNTRHILFDSDHGGDTVLMTGYAYNLRLAAAKVWLTKASHRTALIDWKAGGQTLSEDQEYQHCMQKFNEFAGPNGISAVVPGLPASNGSTRLKKTGYVTQTPLTDIYPKGTEPPDLNGPVA